MMEGIFLKLPRVMEFLLLIHQMIKTTGTSAINVKQYGS